MGETIDDEGLSETFGVVSLEDVKDLSACSGTGILGATAGLEIDEEGKSFDALGHHIDRSFKTIDELLNLAGGRIGILSGGDQVQTRTRKIIESRQHLFPRKRLPSIPHPTSKLASWGDGGGSSYLRFNQIGSQAGISAILPSPHNRPLKPLLRIHNIPLCRPQITQNTLP
jgi:hypothetical protein